MNSDNVLADSSSFRDPSGHVFYLNKEVFRRVNTSYKIHYDHLVSSGLYDKLTQEGLLVAHEEVTGEFPEKDGQYKVIKPKLVKFISYPYEWCFDQIKDAALLTLNIQKIALGYGMILKDASAYNVQFEGVRPVFIDTLSFEIYKEGTPWIAYRQFCQHFLAVLALMKFNDSRLSTLLKSFIDGIPLDLASALLPKKTFFNFSILSHIHLQGKAIKKYGSQKGSNSHLVNISKTSLVALIDHLETSVRKLSFKRKDTQWGNYYDITNYTTEGLSHKETIVKQFMSVVNPGFIWDIGANDGRFSRLFNAKDVYIVSADLDHGAIQNNYLICKEQAVTNLLPLVMDMTNPSPGIGWRNSERNQFDKRTKPDVIIALALIHHLYFTHNIGFDSIASYLQGLCEWLIIEFVHADDSQVQLLPKPSRELADVYDQTNFENSFLSYFSLQKKEQVSNSKRFIYLFRSK